MKIRVDEKACTKCGLCLKYCSFGAIEYREGIPVFNSSCVLCGACVKPCPVSAIRIDRKVLERDLSGYSGVMAFIEMSGDEVKNVGIEMLSAARKLADKIGEGCSAVALGVKGDKVRSVLSEYGADRLYVVENEQLKSYSTELYTNIMVGVLSKYKPSIVLFGATHLGRDLAPRVAGRIDTGLTADCDPEALHRLRHIGPDPARHGDEGIPKDHRHKQGQERADFQDGRPGYSRRRGRGRAPAHEVPRGKYGQAQEKRRLRGLEKSGQYPIVKGEI